MLLVTTLFTTGVRLIDGVPQGPEPEDVKAGWVAFGVFLALCAAVALLGVSLVKQLRRAQAAKDAGVYGDEPVRTPDDGEPEAASAETGSDRGTDEGAEPPRG